MDREGENRMEHEKVNYVLSSPEGPVRLDTENLLVVEMGEDAGTVSRINLKTGKLDRLIRTGRPNGLALDFRKNIWIAESASPALLRYTLNGTVETVLTGYGTLSGTAPFLFPNDFAMDGDVLYMTDSGMLASEFCPEGVIRKDYATACYYGKVFRINLKDPHAEIVDEGLKFPNGIAFGPDGRLYVNETITGNVYYYEKPAGNQWKSRQFFSNVIHDDGLNYYRGPDGMKFSKKGNLYCTVYGQGDVVVIDPSGKIINVLPTKGKCPTNLVFVDRKIYVTEVQNGTLEIFDVGEEGLAD
jgi:gluconolactonase